MTCWPHPWTHPPTGQGPVQGPASPTGSHWHNPPAGLAGQCLRHSLHLVSSWIPCLGDSQCVVCCCHKQLAKLLCASCVLERPPLSASSALLCHQHTLPHTTFEIDSNPGGGRLTPPPPTATHTSCISFSHPLPPPPSPTHSRCCWCQGVQPGQAEGHPA